MKKLFFTAMGAIAIFKLNAQFGTFLDGGTQNGFTFSDVRSIGIGNFDATNNTAARLHLRNSLLSQPTNTLFNGFLFRTDGFANVSNSWKMFTETSGVFSEVFKLEASANTTDFLLQATQTSGNIIFNTGGTNQRAVITSTGLFGINAPAPANRLEITSSTGDPYFGSANGSSGLRLTHLINSNTPLSNPSGNVLSVDANGDVVLVSPGGGSGSVTGQSGLSNFNPSTVELGGDPAVPAQVAASALLTHRDLPLNGFNMQWIGSGKFNITSVNTILSAPAHYASKINFYNSEYTSALFTRTDLSALTGTLSFGAVIDNVTSNNAPNYGLAVTSESSNEANGGAFSAYSTHSTLGSTGVAGTAKGGKYAYGGAFVGKDDPANPSNTFGTIGAYVIGTNGTNSTYGLLASAEGTTAIEKFGVCGLVSISTANNVSYGVSGIAITGNPSGYTTGAKVYGVYGKSGLADENYCVYGELRSGAGNKGYCVFGDAGNAGGYNEVFAGFFRANNSVTPNVNVGVYAFSPVTPSTPSPINGNYAGYFDGDAFITGTASSPNAFFITSDRSIKKDIKDIESASSILSKIKPKTYHLDNKNVPQLNMDEKRLQYGVIAQELEEILPELVKNVTILSDYDKDQKAKNDMKSLKSVNYTGLIPILIAGFNEQKTALEEQQKLVSDLTKKISDLQKMLDNQAANNTGFNTTPVINVVVSDKNVNSLAQNKPNPFGESTSITYNIANEFKTAQMIFSSEDGKVIKTVDIKTTGSGTLNIFATDLTNGVYSYSLVIDGQMIDSKKMIRTQ